MIDSSLPELQSVEISSDGSTCTLTFDEPIPIQQFHPAGRWKLIPPHEKEPYPVGSLPAAMGLNGAEGLVYVPPGWLRRVWWRLCHWRS